MASPTSTREIFTLASECSALFQRYARTDQELSKPPTKAQKDVASLSRDFEAWCFNLGVFAAPTASLDQTLRYSDEIRDFVTELLSILQINLNFMMIHAPPENPSKPTSQPSQKNDDAVGNLQGSVEEAVKAILGVLQRLDRLGATIRKSSTSSLSIRVKAFAEQDNDEEYRLLSKNILAFKYPTAPSSLHAQLAESMAYRRLRLRYIRQHQVKTAPKGLQDSIKRNHGEQSLSNPKSTNIKLEKPMPKDGPAAFRNQALYRPKGNIFSKDAETTPSTTAWTFRPTSSTVERVKRDDSKSVVSSSKASTTRMAGHLDDYPDPPTHDQWSQDPKCPTCWRQLLESELKGKRWRRHVEIDCEPYVCISENCKQPLQFFSDLTLWENHMRNRHSPKWTQLVHKPTVWICDVDHDDEEFRDHESFQEHLRQDHAYMDEADRKAVSTLCETPVTRPKHTCPLCGYDLSLQQENHSEHDSNTSQENDMDQLAKLANHIGGHIRCLAFDTLDHLASDHESVSDAGTDTTSGKAKSRSRPPSEFKDLDDVSFEFPDDNDPRSVSTHDEFKTRQDGNFTLDDDTSHQVVSILPEFEEDWEGIRDTTLDENDPILHSMMAYSLWDRAYDNLKKEDPVLAETYEIILSKELAQDAERESESNFNQFHGVNIHERRKLLGTILGKLLDRLWGMCQDVLPVLHVLPWIEVYTKTSTESYEPAVSFCLILSILADVGVTAEFDLTRFVKVTSKLPDYFALELGLSDRCDFLETRTSRTVQLERHSCQLFQKMLEFQLRIVNSGGQLAKPDDAGGPTSEDDNPEIPDIGQYLRDPGYHTIKLRNMLNNPRWTEINLIEAIKALIPAESVYYPTHQENLQRLQGVLEIDPRKVKDKIEHASGGLRKDSHNWFLNLKYFHRPLNDPQVRLLWISGGPGIGKTMLLCGLIDELSAKPIALSYFFCRISYPSLNSGVAVLGGLLYMLACQRPSLISRYDLLGEQLAENPSTWEPLAKLVSSILEDPLLEGAVLVVDALNECISDRDSLIEFIKKPSRVKWIVSSRDLPDFRNAWNGLSHVTLRPKAHDMSHLVDTYSRLKLGNLGREKNFDRRIRTILDSPHSSLCKRILAIATVVFRPVTLEELGKLDFELQDVDEELLKELILTCGSFLTLHDKTIYFVHHSSREFLLSAGYRLVMPSGVARQQAGVFAASMKWLNNTLYEDIYSLRNPGVHVDVVPRLDHDPLLAGRYSCTNWVRHLEYARTESTLHEVFWDTRGVLSMFLQVHLLHWFEALSLLRGVPEALEALRCLLASRETLQSLHTFHLAQDAYRFLLCHEDTITHFPLQVYASALVFSPDQSMVKQLFGHQTSTWMTSLPRIRGSWDSQAVKAHSTRLLPMAWSWDTQRVVSCSHDGSITMWDTGADVCVGNISNHGTSVTLVAFSTDGRRFASASSDGLIKIWDADTCEWRMELLGHRGIVNQVVFSANGNIIAAAYLTGPLQIWGGRYASSVQVLDGRCESTGAIAFSPDGQILASGSIEGRIVLWDVAMGQVVRGLEAHGYSVVSMSFSGDGQQLASSYSDGTLMVWATATGAQLQVIEVGRAMRHLSFDPNDRHCLLTDIGRLEISFSGAFFPGYSLSADNCWILKDGKPVLFIPPKYRSESLGGPVVRGSMVGLVSDTGDILTMRFA